MNETLSTMRNLWLGDKRQRLAALSVEGLDRNALGWTKRGQGLTVVASLGGPAGGHQVGEEGAAERGTVATDQLEQQACGEQPQQEFATGKKPGFQVA
jgi:hypothetical protein